MKDLRLEGGIIEDQASLLNKEVDERVLEILHTLLSLLLDLFDTVNFLYLSVTLLLHDVGEIKIFDGLSEVFEPEVAYPSQLEGVIH